MQEDGLKLIWPGIVSCFFFLPSSAALGIATGLIITWFMISENSKSENRSKKKNKTK